MKGQIYLVTAIFIMIMLVFLRASVMDVSNLRKESFYDDFIDLKEEYVHVISTSLLNSENITDNLDEFVLFSEEYYSQRGMNHTISYNVSQTSSNAIVDVYIYLGNDKSYLSDSFTIERDVY
ncbi:MAG: hypothetical protein GOV02_02115 [Candidatus Aenigmarchaeota archaeon]|nr:hypothetical protein [Candidatus Aenigmarchaeota archaeon]